MEPVDDIKTQPAIESVDGPNTLAFSDRISTSRLTPIGSAELLSVGSVVGNYEIVKKIDSGGMGSVYKARYREGPMKDMTVAIKVANPENSFSGGQEEENVALRFVFEAKIAARLGIHPGICTILELGIRPDGSHFIVMPHIQGKSLADYCGQLPVDNRFHAEPFSWKTERTDIFFKSFIKILDAIGLAHNKGVVHRDLKPANILLDEGCGSKSEYPQPIIIDWGLADYMRVSKAEYTTDSETFGFPEWTRAIAPERSFTTQVVTLGSPDYMSPEQCRSSKVDGRADIFSLGIILYQHLTGVHPFANPTDSPIEIMKKVIASYPPHPKLIHQSLPQGLCNVCMHALTKDPNYRFQTAAVFRAALLDQIGTVS